MTPDEANRLKNSILPLAQQVIAANKGKWEIRIDSCGGYKSMVRRLPVDISEGLDGWYSRSFTRLYEEAIYACAYYITYERWPDGYLEYSGNNPAGMTLQLRRDAWRNLDAWVERVNKERLTQ